MKSHCGPVCRGPGHTFKTDREGDQGSSGQTDRGYLRKFRADRQTENGILGSLGQTVGSQNWQINGFQGV